MPPAVKIYASLIIAGGAGVLAMALSTGIPDYSSSFVIYLVLAILASLVKLRLPGVDGAYSLGFFFILTGLCYFTLTETLAAACISAITGTLLTRENRATLVQTLFNVANLVISVGVCHLLVGVLRGRGLEPYHPAVLAAIAFLYFVVNTGIVSGVLSILERKQLTDVCREWYFWSFPYYVVGVIIVGFLPLSGQPMHAVGWLALLPPLYLLHFFHGLTKQAKSEDSTSGDAGTLQLPKAAQVYIGAVIVAAGLVLSWSMIHGSFAGWLKPLSFLAVAIPASFLKIPLPGVTGTVSLSFVVHLAALIELPLPELLILAGVSAAIQSIWGSNYRPAPIQVLFNVAVLLLSAGFAFAVFQWCYTAIGQPLLLPLLFATTALYFTDTLLVAAVLCLVEAKPLSQMWQGCYYWSFPYYLVGAAFAAVMSSTGLADNSSMAFLGLPLLALLYVSYRLLLSATTARPPGA